MDKDDKMPVFEPKNGLTRQEADAESDAEFSEEALITPQRITNLQRHSTTSVTNIQIAADARESMRRKELEEARKIRSERLENDVKSSQEHFEKIIGRWSMAKEKVIPEELQAALNSQRQLCALLLEEKKKLVHDLQQELKVGDNRFVKDLRKQAEELDLMMMDRMENQIETLTTAYREEMEQIEGLYRQESEVSLTTDKSAWDRLMKELWETTQERLAERRKEVEEYEVKIHSLMLETMDKQSVVKTDQNAKLQVLEREHQNMHSTNMLKKLKQIKEKHSVETHQVNQAHLNSRIVSLQAEMKNLVTRYNSQANQSSKKGQNLSSGYTRNVQKYQRIQKKVNRVAVADAGKFEQMWLVVDAEVKQLAERALEIHSLILAQHLDGTREPRPAAFTGPPYPIQPENRAQVFQTKRAVECSQATLEATDGPRSEVNTERRGRDVSGEETGERSESDAELEEGKLSMETLMKIMEPLCDEAGFLMEEDLLKLLAPLEKEEQSAMKLGSLLYTLGIEAEDFPKLAHFFLKYKQQQNELTEGVGGEPGESSDQASAMATRNTSPLTSDLVHPNHVLPALKHFLKQHTRFRVDPDHHQSSVLQVEARDGSEDKAYWERMGDTISEDKVTLWGAAETTLKQYHVILKEISELAPETDSMRRQNAELQMLLQQSLTPPTVCASEDLSQ